MATANEIYVSAMWDLTAKVKVKKVGSFSKLPTRGSENAAGYDLYAATDSSTRIPPHKTVMIGTGLSFEFPSGTFAAIFARSGIASKRGLRPANCVGVIDNDYRGEVIVALHNDTDEEQIIEAHERIAQLVLLPFVEMTFIPSEKLSNTVRSDSGFGDSGKF